MPLERPQKASVGRKAGRKGHGAKLEALRERAVLALLTDRTIGEAASRCGVGERTLRRWLAEDVDFKLQYEAARTAIFQEGMNRVQVLVVRAVDTLEDLL